MKIKVKIRWRYGTLEGEAVDEFGYDGFNPLDDIRRRSDEHRVFASEEF